MPLLPAAYDQTTEQALLTLLTLRDPDGNVLQRLANDLVSHQSRGQTYRAYPFAIVLPEDSDDRAGTASLTIDNVSQEITRAIRATREPPEVTIELVWSGTPDLVEKTLDFLVLTDASYDAMSVSFTLEALDLLAQPWTTARYDPVAFPDIFT